MIQPTVGRVVWYWPDGPKVDQPRAAIIASVHSDTCVNLLVIDENGGTHGATSVHLHQGGVSVPPLPYAEWMPYQKGQAAKTEALEKKLAE